MKTTDELINDFYSGKILKGLEYGQNEPGSRTVTLNQKIKSAYIGCNGEDAGIFLELENDEVIFAYNNEIVEII